MILSFASIVDEEAANGADDGTYSKLKKMLRKQKVTFGYEEVVMALNELISAPSLKDISKLRHPHPLKGNMQGCFAIDIDSGARGRLRIVFKPTNKGSYKDGDFSTVREITIEKLVMDYH
jgi:hypothetical protein